MDSKERAEFRQRVQQLREKLDEYDEQFMDCGSAAELMSLLIDYRRTGFDSGFQLGGRVVEQAWKDSAAQALLEAMGKDRGDGPINLGSAGTHYAQNRS